MPNDPIQTDVTTIFGMKMNDPKYDAKSKRCITAGLVGLFLAFGFHIAEVFYQSKLAAAAAKHGIDTSSELGYRVMSGLSFFCLWMAVLMLFQAVIQQRKALSSRSFSS